MIFFKLKKKTSSHTLRLIYKNTIFFKLKKKKHHRTRKARVMRLVFITITSSIGFGYTRKLLIEKGILFSSEKKKKKKSYLFFQIVMKKNYDTKSYYLLV